MLGLMTTQLPDLTTARRLRDEVSRLSARQTIAETCSPVSVASSGARSSPSASSSEELMVTTGADRRAGRQPKPEVRMKRARSSVNSFALPNPR